MIFTMKMRKNYDLSLEKKCYSQWMSNDLFECGKGTNTPYSIMLPPPNITGNLHMGHGFQQTLMDLLIRYHRMMGHDTLWQPGTDHAGIATQMVVERKLNAEGYARKDLGREKFIKKIWEWKEYSGNLITNQMHRLGVSVDWSRNQFTLDDNLSKAVSTCFVKLYEDGLIYRGERLVNWDPKLLTAVSDLEVVQQEEKGSLWHFTYLLVEGGKLEVATTRPETILGDVALAVNPKDERYQHLIGKMVYLPLTDRKIPIISDDYVDITFGTGCVKITPAHDFNDYKIGKNHQLPLINIFTPEGKINSNAPLKYQGLDRFEARKRIVADMHKKGFLIKIFDHTLKIPRGDRSGVILEPYLTKQWFVRVTKLKKIALEVVEKGKIKFFPDNWKNTYYSWMNNLEDWCISRQLWWGHRIPAWYDEDNNIYVGVSEKSVREKYKLSNICNLHQDDDVFDTWFSSALWPFSTLGWPKETLELKKYYPTNVLVTGFDIIFFWVARMIMFGLYFTGEVPFKEVYVTGLVRDSEGQKMSKSKGNVLDPIDLIDGISLKDLIEKRTQSLMQPQMKLKIKQQTCRDFGNGIESYGTDALRFTYAALSSTSRDICFDVSRMEGYRNFCNKLWNASRFVVTKIGETKALENLSVCNKYNMGVCEDWIWHELNQTISLVHQHLASYRFDLLAHSIYEFVWNQYCDWYLEFAKAVLKSKNIAPKYKQTVQYTLIFVLDKILHLAHPIIPFITEEIFKKVKVLTKNMSTSIMVSHFPVYDKSFINEEALSKINWVKKVVIAIRNIRSEMNITPGVNVPLYIKNTSEQEFSNIEETKLLIQSMGNISYISFNAEDIPVSATGLVNSMELHIPLAGNINISIELERLKNKQVKLEKDITYLTTKLNNKNFINKAPSEIIAKETKKLQECRSAQARVMSRLEKLQHL